MDSVLQLTPEQRNELFVSLTQKIGFTSEILEKDFWVCWMLKELFGLPSIGEHLIFKGGTSLSKVFKAIERFSEDIDVSMDRAFLGFGGSNEPEGGASNKEKQRRVDALKVACQTKITAELLPALRGALEAKLERRDKWVLRSDETDPDRQTLLFEYPTSSPAAVGSYVRRVVKIEMGARADHWPCETKPVTPYVAEAFPQAFKNPGCKVKVLAVERTFWEKATILHAEFHRPRDKAMPKRFSRHYADLYELICRGMDAPALSQLDLLARVVQHKTLFFKSSWARHDEAVRGTLRLMPPEHRLTALQDDYARMREMFFHEPPAFDAIMAKLKKWEEDFNRP